MIRVGLEASSVCKPVHTGIQVYITELLAAMDRLVSDDTAVDVKVVYKWSHWNRRQYRARPKALGEQWYIGGIVPPVMRADIVHALDMRMPNVRRAMRITTVYDLAVLHEAHQFDAYATQRFRDNKREKFTKLFAQSDRVIAISENTKQDIAALFGYPEDRIDVIYPGLPDAFQHDIPLSRSVLAKYGLSERGYALYVGPPSERKNVHRMIDAYAQAAAQECPLVIAGNPAHASPSVRTKLDEPRVQQFVRCLGYVSGEDLQSLYAGARAFIFPTLYEGFGIPILEGLASGLPVVTGNRGASPEVAGGFAELVDPFDTGSIAHGIRTVLDDTSPRGEAVRWARGFTWSKAAGEHLALYTRLAGTT